VSFSYVAPTMPGAWFSQGSATRVRAVATALIVPPQPPYMDDRDASSVLVTGGFNTSTGSIVPSGFAEVLSISTASTGAPPVSSPVGSLVTPRWGHTATRLL